MKISIKETLSYSLGTTLFPPSCFNELLYSLLEEKSVVGELGLILSCAFV